MDAGTAYAPILLRAALPLRLIAALMALADSADEQALRRAMGDAAVTSYVADARPAGAYDDKWAGRAYPQLGLPHGDRWRHAGLSLAAEPADLPALERA